MLYKKDPNPGRFLLADWHFLQRLSPACRLLQHRHTGKHCEEYLLDLQSEAQKLCFEQRLASPSPCLVRVLHVEAFSHFSAANLFTHYTLRIFIEHIRFRLSDVPELPEEYLLGLLEDSLGGFRVIFEEYQPVRVQAAMIGINEDKKVKVWLSPDLLANALPSEEPVSQQLMVDDVFRVYERISRRREDRPKGMGFQEAIAHVERKRALQKSIAEGSTHSTTRLSSSPVRRANIQHQTPPQSQPAKPATHLAPPDSEPQGGHANRTAPTFCERRELHSMVDSSEPSPNFEDDPSRRHSIVVHIESARTTSKHLAVGQTFIELDKSRLHQELLDEKKSKQARLEIIGMAMEASPHDETVQRVCRIFNHALRYDPLMYCELKRVDGRISQIANGYVLGKIVEVTGLDKRHEDHQPVFPGVQRVDTREVRIKTQQEILSPETEKAREERLKRILEKERLKRNRTVYNKKGSLNTAVNRTNPPPEKTVRSEIKQPQKFEEEPREVPDYVSELESLIGPSGTFTAIKQSQNVEKKKQKTKFYKDFKE